MAVGVGLHHRAQAGRSDERSEQTRRSPRWRPGPRPPRPGAAKLQPTRPRQHRRDELGQVAGQEALGVAEAGGAPVHVRGQGGGSQGVDAAGEKRSDDSRQHVAGARRREPGRSGRDEEALAVGGGDHRRRPLQEHDRAEARREGPGRPDPVGARATVPALGRAGQPLVLAVVGREHRRHRRRASTRPHVRARRARRARRRRRRPEPRPRRRGGAPRRRPPAPIRGRARRRATGSGAAPASTASAKSPAGTARATASDTGNEAGGAPGTHQRTMPAPARSAPFDEKRAAPIMPGDPATTTTPTSTCCVSRARARQPARDVGVLDEPQPAGGTAIPIGATSISPASSGPSPMNRPGLSAAIVTVCVGARQPPRRPGRCPRRARTGCRRPARASRPDDGALRTRPGTPSRRRRRSRGHSQAAAGGRAAGSNIATLTPRRRSSAAATRPSSPLWPRPRHDDGPFPVPAAEHPKSGDGHGRAGAGDEGVEADFCDRRLVCGSQLPADVDRLHAAASQSATTTAAATESVWVSDTCHDRTPRAAAARPRAR